MLERIRNNLTSFLRYGTQIINLLWFPKKRINLQSVPRKSPPPPRPASLPGTGENFHCKYFEARKELLRAVTNRENRIFFDLSRGIKRVFARHLPASAFLTNMPNGDRVSHGKSMRGKTLMPEGMQVPNIFRSVAERYRDVTNERKTALTCRAISKEKKKRGRGDEIDIPANWKLSLHSSSDAHPF